MSKVAVSGNVSGHIKDKRTGQITSRFSRKNTVLAPLAENMFSLMARGNSGAIDNSVPNKVRISNSNNISADTFQHGAGDSNLTGDCTIFSEGGGGTNTLAVGFVDQEVTDTGSGDGSRTLSKLELLSDGESPQVLAEMTPMTSGTQTAGFPNAFMNAASTGGIEFNNFSLFTLTYTVSFGFTGWPDYTDVDDYISRLMTFMGSITAPTPITYDLKLVRASLHHDETAAQTLSDANGGIQTIPWAWVTGMTQSSPEVQFSSLTAKGDPSIALPNAASHISLRYKTVSNPETYKTAWYAGDIAEANSNYDGAAASAWSPMTDGDHLKVMLKESGVTVS